MIEYKAVELTTNYMMPTSYSSKEQAIVAINGYCDGLKSYMYDVSKYKWILVGVYSLNADTLFGVTEVTYDTERKEFVL